MKYANLIHAIGVIVVVLYSVMKIFDLGGGYINVDVLLTLGFLLGYVGQSMKVKLLRKENK